MEERKRKEKTKNQKIDGETRVSGSHRCPPKSQKLKLRAQGTVSRLQPDQGTRGWSSSECRGEAVGGGRWGSLGP